MKKFLLLFAVVLVGCNNNPDYAVAVINEQVNPGSMIGYSDNYDQAIISNIDGRAVGGYPFVNARLTPGRHTLTVNCIRSADNVSISSQNTITMTTQAGEAYQLYVEPYDGQCRTYIKPLKQPGLP